MSTRIKGKSAINRKGIAQAVNNKTFLNNLSGGYRNGQGYYIINGQEVNSQKVEMMHPTKTIPMLIKGANPNKTQVY
jgi:hypothetical protein